MLWMRGWPQRVVEAVEAVEVQAGQLGCWGPKGKDQLLGQEGLSGRWPRVAWF